MMFETFKENSELEEDVCLRQILFEKYTQHSTKHFEVKKADLETLFQAGSGR